MVECYSLMYFPVNYFFVWAALSPHSKNGSWWLDFVVLPIVSQHSYTEEYEQQRGKGSFPAMITPGYQMAKKANDMASDVSFANLTVNK